MVAGRRAGGPGTGAGRGPAPAAPARGWEPLQVSFVGKAATLCLLYAFPLLLLGVYGGPAAEVAQVAGWAFGLWGTALYWWAAGLYLAQTRQLTE